MIKPFSRLSISVMSGASIPQDHWCLNKSAGLQPEFSEPKA
jgi:hypothetical protein